MKWKFAARLAAVLLALAAPAAWAATITGTVTGPDGAPFRAAFVRVQNMKTKMTTMVLSDSQGRYWADKLDAGTYEVWATWVGYRSDPFRQRNVTLDDGSRMRLDFTMKNDAVEWSQLTKYQAGTLIPQALGNGKDVLIQQCFNCHAFAKIGAVGRHDVSGWKDEIDVMRLTGVARIRPEITEQVSKYLAAAFGPDSVTPESPAQLAGYQAVKQDRDYFSDESLNIIYVDYALTGDPRDRPGSARPDQNGKLWLEMSAGLSRLDPDTGELKTWRLTNLSSNFIHEVLPTTDGSVWLTLEAQGGLARFDTGTEKFEVFIDQDANDKSQRSVPQSPNSGRHPGRRRQKPHRSRRSRRQYLGVGPPAEKVRSTYGEIHLFPHRGAGFLRHRIRPCRQHLVCPVQLT
jgi:hypothetical protein